jgi:hypothetical protein
LIRAAAPRRDNSRAASEIFFRSTMKH